VAFFVNFEDLTSAEIKDFDLVIIGAGFYGLTIAQLAAEQGKSVLVIEKRDFIGGNAASFFENETGIEVHPYGSHLFHTSSTRVWEYVKRFTEFNSYQHTVWARVGERLLSLPVNLQTISQILGKAVTPTEARSWLDLEAANSGVASPENFRDAVISQVGERIYKLLYEGYTHKQWQTPPEQLPKEVASRLPVRTNLSNRYFGDKWEGLPVDGYSAWQNRMVESDRIFIALGVDFFVHRESIDTNSQLVIYTGPLDKYFDYEAGHLSWRTLDFQTEVLGIEDFQGAAVVNYPEVEIPWTRIHEFRHLHPERDRKMKGTVVMKEFSRMAGLDDEPYYPVNSTSDRDILEKYRSLVRKEGKVIFGGRLGSYQYLDMHMAIGSAISKFEAEVTSRIEG
jgi:UDP-galactopyranose mutase